MTVDQERVSAVVPTYQRAHLIADALDSVAGQTWRPFEIVVVDDGSTDGTKDAVAAWAAAHPDIPVRFLWQENAGGNAARNAGIAAARGAFVAFLDSDDTWDATKTEKQMAVFSDPGIGAVYCGLRETEAETGKTLHEPPLSAPDAATLARLLVRDETGPTSAWIVRKTVLQAVGGFDPDLRARQDWDLWIRLAAQTRIASVPERLFSLRHHGGPRTASDPTRELRAYRAIRAKNATLLAKHPLPVRLAARAAFHRRSGRVRLRYMGQRWRALGHYGVAIALWPVEPDSWFAFLGWFMPSGLRQGLRKVWNRTIGRGGLGIRSH